MGADGAVVGVGRDAQSSMMVSSEMASDAPLGRGRPSLKLQRARQLMHDLRSAIDEYRYGAGFHVDLVPDAATSTIAFVLRVTEPPRLDEWALLFGDGVHNARASLDHLAWCLDPKPARDTSFPIFMDTPHDWPPPAVARMPKIVQDIIWSLQPFHETNAGREPARHPLGTAHEMDIRDKHRTLTVAVAALGGDVVSGLPFGASLSGTLWQEFRDGVTVNSVHLPGGITSAPALSCIPAFDAVLVDRPWRDSSILYVLDAVIIAWIENVVMPQLLPHTRP
jgi:hypothetical protein